jgi:hypothetical protein
MFRADNAPSIVGAVLVAGMMAALFVRPAGPAVPARATSEAPAPPRPAGITAAPASDPSDPAAVEGALAGASRVTVVTALLPDPQAQELAGDFDEGIETLERAAESAGYVLERLWLPWSRQGGGAAVSRDSAHADRAGWLLFRSDMSGADPQRLDVRRLVLLLVAERPGSGVDRAMLADALAIEARVGRPVHDAGVQIVGPYFSGTAVSLRSGLEAWCARDAEVCASRPVSLLSGTATRHANGEILNITAGADRASPRLRATFSATVNSDDALADAMNAFFADTLGVGPGERAELTETSTAFGNAFAKSARAGAEEPLRIAFPAHIAGLRDDARDNSQADTRAADVVPPMSSAVADGDTNLALNMTFWALRRQGVANVGVLATLARDKVFLVTRLRAVAPDVRAYVYEASVILAAPKDRQAMDGTLVASSYPLSPTTQIWNGRASGAQPFPSEAAEGIYNAMVALLHESLEGGLVRPELLKDYIFPFGPSTRVGPSVWISVIIRGQLWPVVVYRPAPDGYVFGARLPAPAGTVEPPRLDTSAVMLTALIALTFLTLANLVALLSDLFSPRWLPPRARQALHRWARMPGLLVRSPAGARRASWPVTSPQGHRVVLFGICVLATAGGAGAALWELPRLALVDAPFRPSEILAAFLFVASTALLVVAVVRGRVWRFLSIGRLLGHGFFALLVAFAVARLCRFVRTGSSPDGRAIFFFTRLMHPALQLTPALPIALMMAALYVGCLFRLRVLRRSVRLLAASQAWRSPGFAGCGEAMASFARQAQRSLGLSLVIGTLVGVTAYLVTPLRPRSLEGPAFDFLAALAFGVTFTTAAASIWRAAGLWVVLSRLLRRLAVHPTVWAYDHMPAFFARAFRTPLPRRIAEEDAEAACAPALALVGANPLEAGAATALPADAVERGTTETIRDITRELAPFWARTGAAPPALQKEEPERPLAVQVREHYLALRMAETLACMCDVTSTMLFIGASSVVAAVLATAAYPFQPAGTLAWAATLAVATVVAVSFRLIVGVERDEVLSRLGGTVPGRVTLSWSLATRLIGYVLIPLGSLLAAHLPNHAPLRDLIAKTGKLLEP